MALPTRPLPMSAVDVNGESVPFRALSRAEALSLQDFRGREDEAETQMLMWACDVSEEEAEAWRKTTMNADVNDLINAIVIFSGIATKEQIAKAEAAGTVVPDPKLPMNGRSSKARRTPMSSPSLNA